MNYVITKKIRDEAALVCAISASSDEPHWYWTIGEALGLSQEATSLAADALVQLTADENYTGTDGRFWSRESDAATESALRTGFVPQGWRSR